MEGNTVINKQTNKQKELLFMELDQSLTIRQLLTQKIYQAIKKLTQKIPSAASKRGHETEKHVLIESQTCRAYFAAKRLRLIIVNPCLRPSCNG